MGKEFKKVDYVGMGDTIHTQLMGAFSNYDYAEAKALW